MGTRFWSTAARNRLTSITWIALPVSGGAVFDPTHLAPPTIRCGTTTYGGAFLCDHRPRCPTPLPKSLSCKPFPRPPRVVRDWHWPCLVVRYTISTKPWRLSMSQTLERAGPGQGGWCRHKIDNSFSAAQDECRRRASRIAATIWSGVWRGEVLGRRERSSRPWRPACRPEGAGPGDRPTCRVYTGTSGATLVAAATPVARPHVLDSQRVARHPPRPLSSRVAGRRRLLTRDRSHQPLRRRGLAWCVLSVREQAGRA
jgi:hypothetical protein